MAALISTQKINNSRSFFIEKLISTIIINYYLFIIKQTWNNEEYMIRRKLLIVNRLVNEDIGYVRYK